MPRKWKAEYNVHAPSFTVRRDAATWEKVRELQSSWSDGSDGSDISISETVRRAVELAWRSRVKRETIEPPPPPKPRCGRCGGEAGYHHECWGKEVRGNQLGEEALAAVRHKLGDLG